MERSAIDLWVGIFVAAGIAALLFLALKAGNVDSIIKSEGYLVSAEFDNIGGLKAKAPVKSAGVVVGQQPPKTTTIKNNNKSECSSRNPSSEIYLVLFNLYTRPIYGRC